MRGSAWPARRSDPRDLRGLNHVEVAAITGHKTLQILKRYTHLKAKDLVGRLG
jgi:hypothetical protein